MALSLIAIIALIVLCIVLIKKLFRSIIKLCKKGAQMWNSMREKYIEEMKNQHENKTSTSGLDEKNVMESNGNRNQTNNNYQDYSENNNMNQKTKKQ